MSPPLSPAQFGPYRGSTSPSSDTYPTRSRLSTAMGFSARREAARRVSRAPQVDAQTFPATLPAAWSN